MIVRPTSLITEFNRMRKPGLKRATLSMGYPSLDENIKLIKGFLMVVTGNPGSGKSEWWDAVLVNMAVQHGWKSLLYSPENHPVEEHMTKIAEKFIGKGILNFTDQDTDTALTFMKEHFVWYNPESIPTPAEFVERVDQEIDEFGLDCASTDPWNAMKHSRKELREDEYLAEQLTSIISFSRRKNILFTIIAHPKSLEAGRDGKVPVPTLSSISGGAMWRNKADYGIVCHRPDKSRNMMEVRVQKIKQKWMGRVGMKELDYDYFISGRFKCTDSERFTLPLDLNRPF